jgi:hypothetical protein
MGLRQTFFLLDGLLDRLIYLSLGLGVILGFVGIKLIVHASHEAGLDISEISTGISLSVIVLTLAVTVIASLARVREALGVYATHDVNGHHHAPGVALEELCAHTGAIRSPLRLRTSTRTREPAEPDRQHAGSVRIWFARRMGFLCFGDGTATR